jgi:hypothetical protein
MRRIDALHLDYPFAGSRMLRDLLRGENVVIGRDMVRTMMRRMCIEALHRRPNTSKAAPGHKIYPYLLRGLAIERPNQVWCMCGRPPERKVFCVIRRSERVRSCLRPSTRCLYDRWPRWVSPNGPQTRMRHGTAFAPSGVSCSSVRPIAISCYCLFAPRRGRTIRQLAAISGKPCRSSSWPTRCGPSCWPEPPQPLCVAGAPAISAATGSRSGSLAWHGGSPS